MENYWSHIEFNIVFPFLSGTADFFVNNMVAWLEKVRPRWQKQAKSKIVKHFWYERKQQEPHTNKQT